MTVDPRLRLSPFLFRAAAMAGIVALSFSTQGCSHGVHAESSGLPTCQTLPACKQLINVDWPQAHIAVPSSSGLTFVSGKVASKGQRYVGNWITQLTFHDSVTDSIVNLNVSLEPSLTCPENNVETVSRSPAGRELCTVRGAATFTVRYPAGGALYVVDTLDRARPSDPRADDAVKSELVRIVDSLQE